MKKSQSKNGSQKTKTPPEDKNIAYCRIHPGLGIARIGNSPDEYFIGPESPGHPPAPVGGFKDDLGRIKRQAARFHIYAYNKKGEAIRELTDNDATITWTAELANQKPAYEMFLGEYWKMQYPSFKGKHPLRNQEITDADERERLLVIKPGARTITGANEHGERYVFDKGTIGPLPYTVVNDKNRDCLSGSRSGFLNVPYIPPGPPPPPEVPPAGCTWDPGKVTEPIAWSPRVEVPLGELRTDTQGRLLVLGGLGKSGSIIPDNDLGFLNTDSYYANNDYWYDDSSDGPISAKVVLKGGRGIEVKDKAWVIVAPPKYAPHQQVLTTLYDVAVEAVTKPDPKAQTSFTHDIYPVLSRLNGYQWVNSQAARQHGAGKVYNPLDEERGYDYNKNSLFKLLHTPGKANVDAVNARAHLFSRLRLPYQLLPDQDKYKNNFEGLVNSPAANELANASYMPQMYGDGGGATTFGTEQAKYTPGGAYVTWNTLTPAQYGHFARWATGNFIDDWPKSGKLPPSPLLSLLPVAEQPAALDQAALELCVGGSFYPGIEMTYISRDASTWSGPCRINQTWKPGDITRHMALPWQADFSECNTAWWPVQRPDDVVPESEYETFLKTYEPSMDHSLAEVLQYTQPWARGISDQSPALDNEMVEAWKDFGFVVPKTGPGGQVVYIETERSPYAGTNLRDFFYYLMNIDSYSDFLPKAHALVEEFLAEARVNMHTAAIEGDDRYSFFEYSQETFSARLNQIYNDYVTDNSSESGYEAGLLQTREDVIYDKVQMAPFNQLDGAWLRNAAPSGPIGEVESILFNIYMDELGDGNVEQQHCNVYTDMLKTLNIYLPEIHSRDYADYAGFLDSAFVEPVFLLAISEFSEDYLPEILGMTMYLEWGSIGLISVVDQLKAFDIDPQYYSLHVGIDNAASGHGALAKRAIELYLDQVREMEGESTMRDVWKRIWTGYVAFGSLGTLGQDIQNVTTQRNSPQDRKAFLKSQMVDMITRKAPYASLNHRHKTLGNTYINDWFEDPSGFLDALAQGGIIIPGNPDISPIFHLMSFSGPMYHVFTDDEQKLWRDYIISLTEPDPDDPLSVVAAMRELIDYLRERQERNAGHEVLLSGPNPYKSKEKFVTNSIHWWFDLKMDPQVADPDGAFMNALSFEGAEGIKGNGWIVKGDAASSPLVTTMLAGGNAMAKAFSYTAPKTGGQTYKEVIVQWIDQGCPTEEAVHRAALAAAEVKPPQPPRRKLLGMGKVH